MRFCRLSALARFVLPFIAGAAPAAHAAPATYFVNFSGTAPLPAIGTFTYDDASPQFSNFLVSWGGVLFDLTAAANAPMVGGGCPGAVSSAATSFALLQHNLCDGVFSRWFGNQNIGSSSFGFYNETLALPARTGATIVATGAGGDDLFPLLATGDWTLTDASSGGFNYIVNFTGLAPTPALGVFNYDATAQVFSNFVVMWNDTLFDLTDAANAPDVGGGCPGATSSAATSFALLDHRLCDGVFSRWFGNQNIGSSSFGFYNETLALPARTGATIVADGPGGDDLFPVLATGEWTLTSLTTPPPPPPPPTSVPEPAPVSMLLLAGGLSIGLRHVRARRSASKTS